MSDFESQLRAADPLHSLDPTPIDFDAMKYRITSNTTHTGTVSRRRQMRVLSYATVAVLVTTVSLVSLASHDAVRGPQMAHSIPKLGGRAPIIYGTSDVPGAYDTAKNTGAVYAPVPAPLPIYVAGAGLSAPTASGSVYKLNAFDDTTSEAQRLATVFGVTGTMTALPTNAFAAEYQAGDMSSATGSMQYFIQSSQDPQDAGFGLFQYIADGEENWTFNGPITSSVDPATAVRDLNEVHTLWSALDTGFTLSDPTWMVMQLTSESPAATATETQVNFMLTIDGHQTLQGVQFSFDDTGKVVYASGLNLSIEDAITFPFETASTTINLLNARQYGDCSPSFVTATGASTSATSDVPTTTAPAVTETLAAVSILYQPEMMSNGQPWLVPFYQFTKSDGTQSGAPLISALGPDYFSVNKGPGSSCTMTLTQP